MQVNQAQKPIYICCSWYENQKYRHMGVFITNGIKLEEMAALDPEKEVTNTGSVVIGNRIVSYAILSKNGVSFLAYETPNIVVRKNFNSENPAMVADNFDFNIEEILSYIGPERRKGLEEFLRQEQRRAISWDKENAYARRLKELDEKYSHLTPCFKEKVRKMDHYYNYSDNHNAYMNGLEAERSFLSSLNSEEKKYFSEYRRIIF